MNSNPASFIIFLFGIACFCFPVSVWPHDPGIKEATATFHRDGSFQVDLVLDLDARLAGAPAGSLDEMYYRALTSMPDEEFNGLAQSLRDYFQRSIRLRFDGAACPFNVEFPEAVSDRAGIEIGPEATVLGHTARFTGQTPAGAGEFVFFASRAIGALAFKFVNADAEPIVEMLGPGIPSQPYSLARPEPPMPWHRVFAQYLVVGYEHIVPKGLDHILFVLGLFLLGTSMRPLLLQVTAFTVAHSVTLGLSMYGVVSLPSSIVEPLIALSIAYVAIENIFTSKLKPWRPVVVFAFGLLHGLGFAGVLTQWGLPRGQFSTALVAFNVGVELGQLSVIALAFLAVGWYRRRAHYRMRVVVPASAMIAAAGIYWAVMRTIG